jgi:hypothetical protein
MQIMRRPVLDVSILLLLIIAVCCSIIYLAFVLASDREIYIRTYSPDRGKVDPILSGFRVAKEPLALSPVPVKGLKIDRRGLRAVLATLQPYFDPEQFGGKTPVAILTHYLRLWGPNSAFRVRVFGGRVIPALDGELMVNSLFDHRTFLRNAAVTSPALLVSSIYGIQALSSRDSVYQGTELTAHVGQLLQTAGEAGLPSSFAVVCMEGRRGSMAEVVRDSAVRVSRDGELEWLTVGLARYSDEGRTSWSNRFGELWSFDAIADQLCNRPIGAGACCGTHIPYALVVLLRVDEQKGLLSETGRRRAVGYLTHLSLGLEGGQAGSGAWNADWAKHCSGGLPTKVPKDPEAAFYQQIIVTGHHLEWIALAPTELRPREASIQRACDFLIENWPAFLERHLSRDWHGFVPATHAGRALWLLSGIPTNDQDFDSLGESVEDRG